MTSYQRRTRTYEPHENRKSIKPTKPEHPPVMLTLICAGLGTALLEYVYSRAEDEVDKDEVAYNNERVKSINRWLVRRYGPDAAYAFISTTVNAPRKMKDSKIPGMGAVINQILMSSLEDIYAT